MPTDSGTETVLAVLGGADALTDYATISMVEIASGAEKLADTGTLTPAVAVHTHQFLKRFIYTSSRSKSAWPTTTITGPCINPYFRNTTDDKTLLWDVVLEAGQELVVDHRLGTCTIDGDQLAAGAYPTVSGFFQILPGDNIFEIGAEEISEGSIVVSLPAQQLGS